jgi:hypothetical protein
MIGTDRKAPCFVVFSILPCYLVSIKLKYPPQHPILEHPQPVFCSQCERPSFTPTRNSVITPCRMWIVTDLSKNRSDYIVCVSSRLCVTSPKTWAWWRTALSLSSRKYSDPLLHLPSPLLYGKPSPLLYGNIVTCQIIQISMGRRIYLKHCVCICIYIYISLYGELGHSVLVSV